jgi:phosphoribosyl-ATP pyrophosphohydrolase/phosphoribosyl-AMP cyclohydrolase
MNFERLKFDDRGLIPAVVQDAKTGRVLTLAYMNKESLNITLDEGKTCFFSRSRQCLWRKGETSGNVQKVIRVSADCDGDALLIEVEPAGPACHTGEESCFFDRLAGEGERFTLSSLAALIKNRREQPKEGSYTNYLFDKGREKILKKVGEESAEVIVAAMKASQEETVYELADLCYHALVLMEEMGIPVSRVMDELSSRHVVDKKTKQETMR